MKVIFGIGKKQGREYHFREFLFVTRLMTMRNNKPRYCAAGSRLIIAVIFLFGDGCVSAWALFYYYCI